MVEFHTRCNTTRTPTLARPRLCAGILYSDRHKGIPAFEAYFKCQPANCIAHIVTNVRSHLAQLKRKGMRDVAVGFHSEQVHRIQKANTFEGYKKELNLFRPVIPMLRTTWTTWFMKKRSHTSSSRLPTPCTVTTHQTWWRL